MGNKEYYVYKVVIKSKEDFKTEEEFDKWVEEFNDNLKKFKFKTLPMCMKVSSVLPVASKDRVLFRVEKQKEDSPLVRSLFNQYNDYQWQLEHLYIDEKGEKTEKPNEKIIKNYRGIGIIFELKYDTTIKKFRYFVKETKSVKQMFSMWRLEFNLDGDRYLGLTISDGDMPTYEGSEVLEKYCTKSIREMLEKGFVEKIKFEQNEYQEVTKGE